MKKLYALFLVLLLCQSSYASTPVIMGDQLSVIASSVVLTADGVVKATPGYLQGVLVSFKGVTVGDTVDINDNSAAGGTVKVRIAMATANGSFYYQPVAPIIYSTTGIYCDVSISGGSVNVVAQYS